MEALLPAAAPPRASRRRSSLDRGQSSSVALKSICATAAVWKGCKALHYRQQHGRLYDGPRRLHFNLLPTAFHSHRSLYVCSPALLPHLNASKHVTEGTKALLLADDVGERLPRLLHSFEELSQRSWRHHTRHHMTAGGSEHAATALYDKPCVVRMIANANGIAATALSSKDIKGIGNGVSAATDQQLRPTNVMVYQPFVPPPLALPSTNLHKASHSTSAHHDGVFCVTWRSSEAPRVVQRRRSLPDFSGRQGHSAATSTRSSKAPRISITVEDRAAPRPLSGYGGSEAEGHRQRSGLGSIAPPWPTAFRQGAPVPQSLRRCLAAATQEAVTVLQAGLRSLLEDEVFAQSLTVQAVTLSFKLSSLAQPPAKLGTGKHGPKARVAPQQVPVLYAVTSVCCGVPQGLPLAKLRMLTDYTAVLEATLLAPPAPSAPRPHANPKALAIPSSVAVAGLNPSSRMQRLQEAQYFAAAVEKKPSRLHELHLQGTEAALLRSDIWGQLAAVIAETLWECLEGDKLTGNVELLRQYLEGVMEIGEEHGELEDFTEAGTAGAGAGEDDSHVRRALALKQRRIGLAQRLRRLETVFPWFYAVPKALHRSRSTTAGSSVTDEASRVEGLKQGSLSVHGSPKGWHLRPDSSPSDAEEGHSEGATPNTSTGEGVASYHDAVTLADGSEPAAGTPHGSPEGSSTPRASNAGPDEEKGKAARQHDEAQHSPGLDMLQHFIATHTAQEEGSAESVPAAAPAPYSMPFSSSSSSTPAAPGAGITAMGTASAIVHQTAAANYYSKLQKSKPLGRQFAFSFLGWRISLALEDALEWFNRMQHRFLPARTLHTSSSTSSTASSSSAAASDASLTSKEEGKGAMAEAVGHRYGKPKHGGPPPTAAGPMPSRDAGTSLQQPSRPLSRLLLRTASNQRKVEQVQFIQNEALQRPPRPRHSTSTSSSSATGAAADAILRDLPRHLFPLHYKPKGSTADTTPLQRLVGRRSPQPSSTSPKPSAAAAATHRRGSSGTGEFWRDAAMAAGKRNMQGRRPMTAIVRRRPRRAAPPQHREFMEDWKRCPSCGLPMPDKESYAVQVALIYRHYHATLRALRLTAAAVKMEESQASLDSFDSGLNDEEVITVSSIGDLGDPDPPHHHDEVGAEITGFALSEMPAAVWPTEAEAKAAWRAAGGIGLFGIYGSFPGTLLEEGGSDIVEGAGATAPAAAAPKAVSLIPPIINQHYHSIPDMQLLTASHNKGYKASSVPVCEHCFLQFHEFQTALLSGSPPSEALQAIRAAFRSLNSTRGRVTGLRTDSGVIAAKRRSQAPRRRHTTANAFLADFTPETSLDGSSSSQQSLPGGVEAEVGMEGVRGVVGCGPGGGEGGGGRGGRHGRPRPISAVGQRVSASSASAAASDTVAAPPQPWLLRGLSYDDEVEFLRLWQSPAAVQLLMAQQRRVEAGRSVGGQVESQGPNPSTAPPPRPGSATARAAASSTAAIAVAAAKEAREASSSAHGDSESKNHAASHHQPRPERPLSASSSRSKRDSRGSKGSAASFWRPEELSSAYGQAAIHSVNSPAAAAAAAKDLRHRHDKGLLPSATMGGGRYPRVASRLPSRAAQAMVSSASQPLRGTIALAKSRGKVKPAKPRGSKAVLPGLSAEEWLKQLSRTEDSLQPHGTPSEAKLGLYH